ncbi:flagellar basal body P-ring formation chaperone FlgA [Rhodanobacter sp. OK091]|uniref:flagellar basal body P-ring formation chaperone FlgA n=1 Tax=Rhodanobacter sp. OK091 TaxID=1881037 RepID=UPI00091C1566|nr:flagellar basal body P-ring formation chaperone FlgA [Rhodanobacter sp. OK091]SHL69028.1 flagella basal body P-ring formation protein FlgA [Rhodanobacter sp. OK091]
MRAWRSPIAGLGIAALWLGGATAGASAIQSLDSVRATAEQAVRQQYALPGSRIEVTAGSLDLRLQLAECRLPLRAVVARDAQLASRITVPVQCPQEGGWTVRVPLQVQLFRQTLVTSRLLLRGDGVSAADVHVEERDVTRLGYGYIENMEQVAGRSLARAVASGSVLSPGMLGGRRMVRAGDHVEMVARLDGIEVRADGVALGSGDNGARLRVRNESSGKVVDAMVSAPGVVLALP